MSKATVRYEGALRKRVPGAREIESAKDTDGSEKTKSPASRLARMLALAHHVERLVEDGTLKDYADAAELLSITRARMAQVMALLNLSARVQGAILSGKLTVAERGIRSLTLDTNWDQQQTLS